MEKIYPNVISLSYGVIRCIIGKLRGKLWIEQLLSPRGPGFVGALLELSLALVRVVASLEALLALHSGWCWLPAAASPVE